MRTLSPSLLAAQQSPSHVPYVRVEASNRVAGVIRLHWDRLYTGGEADYYHAMALCSSGAMVRARLTPPADGSKLYRQTVSNPGPGADFSNWVYTGHYDCVAVAAAACGNTLSLLWISSSREVRQIFSTDGGVNWGAAELIDYTPGAGSHRLAAAYRPNGDLAVFYTDQVYLYVKQRVSGIWQTTVVWDKTTGDLSGVAAVYDGDWDLLVTGVDANGNVRLWSLVYGDGGDVPAGTWSPLEAVAAAPSGAGYEFSHPCLYRNDVLRACYLEKFSGIQPYERIFASYLVPGTAYKDCLWREPAPGEIAAPYGLAGGNDALGNYCWLSTSNGVWRSDCSLQTIDISDDLIDLKIESGPGKAKLVMELNNNEGVYNTLPPPLTLGCRLDVSPGYVGVNGPEVSDGLHFVLVALEHRSRNGLNSVVLYGEDGWHYLQSWRARDQFRWNQVNAEKNVKQLLALILARSGLTLDVKSESTTISGFYPDFTIHPGDDGASVVDRLLDLVPDVLFIEGCRAWLVHPQASDLASYAYGVTHPVLAASHFERLPAANWVSVAGIGSGGADILADFFDWESIPHADELRLVIRDANLNTLDLVQQRGAAVLRKSAISVISGKIIVPANCGQQLYDVIGITCDGAAALVRRVLGITLIWSRSKSSYLHELTLTGV